MALENKQLRLKLREEKLALIQEQKNQLKEEQIKHIIDFVISYYDVTSNKKDRVQSSIMNEGINSDFKTFINTQLVKETILGNFSSVTNNKTGYIYYRGIKPKQ